MTQIPTSAQKRKLHEGYFVFPVPHTWDNPMVEDVVWYTLVPRSGMVEFNNGKGLNEIEGVYVCNDLAEVAEVLQKEFNNASN